MLLQYLIGMYALEKIEPLECLRIIQLVNFRWYDEGVKTTLIQTGSTYTQPETAVGTYSYWVSDAAISGNGCESQLYEKVTPYYSSFTG